MSVEAVAIFAGVAGAGGYGRFRWRHRRWRVEVEPGADGGVLGTYVYLLRWPRQRQVFARVAYDECRDLLGADELRDKDHETALVEALARARSHAQTLNTARRLSR